MKKLFGALGLVAACAACCAIPFAVPFFGAMASTGTSFAFGLEAALCAAILVFGIAAMLFWYRRRTQAKAVGCAAGASCGTNGEQCG